MIYHAYPIEFFLPTYRALKNIETLKMVSSLVKINHVWFKTDEQLEIMFLKHYAPNPLLVKKGL